MEWEWIELYSTFVASWSITFEKKLFIMQYQSPVDEFTSFCMGIMILDGNMQWPCPFSLYSTYVSRGVVHACFQILLLDFNPQ